MGDMVAGQSILLETKETVMDAYIGLVFPFAGDFPPKGFELCLGQELSINDYQLLYAVIGNKFGGDAKKMTFKLPKLEGPEDLDAKTRLNYIICMDGAFPSRQ
jgi:microcystin-dependent protein